METSQENSNIHDFNIREYSIGSVFNRNHFNNLEYAEQFTGKDESFRSLYQQTEDIIKYAEAQKTIRQKKTVSGYKGAVAAEELVLDIDVKDNLPRALDITRALVNRLDIDFSTDPEHLRIQFSGNKGFHIELPAELFGGFEPSESLPRLQALIARSISLGYEDAVDLDIYYHVALYRIENTKHGVSRLFTIPLTSDELYSLSVDGIKELAKSPRELPKATDIPFVQSLSDLKHDCERRLNQEDLTDPVVSSQTEETVSDTTYSKPEPAKIGRLFKRCRVLRSIEQKSKTGEAIGHKDRVALGTVLTEFGNDGKLKVHELLNNQANYDREKTEYYMDTMARNAYKPELCKTICGEGNLCPAIKAINRRSPIAFSWTYDSETDPKINSYVESYAVDKILKHFDNVIYSSNDQSFYRYEAGVYMAIKDDAVKSLLENFMPFYWPKTLITNTRLNALVDRMKTQSTMRFDGLFNSDTHRINLQNGIFNLDTMALEPHTKSFMSNIQLPFRYDPYAKCPEFDKFISDIFEHDSDVADYIMKIWSYLLLPTYSFQKVWVWYGSGRNGKGTLASLITRMLGLPNVANESIDELVSGRFSAINLKDKLVNFSSELKTGEVDLAMLKKLSGGDMISAEKKFKDKISFANSARLIIMTNELPRFSEVGNAVLERFEFINFPKEYNGKSTDTKLLDRMSAELSGIFNRIVGLLPTIYTDDSCINFSAPRKVSDTKTVVMSELSTVLEFVNEECKRKAGASTKYKDLYEGYRDWSKQSGYRPVGKKTFAGVLKGTCKLPPENNTVHGNQMYVRGLEMLWKASLLTDF
jgi:P4 family phage/plasmid primase-like protien